MNSNEAISSTILSNVDIIADIFNIIKQAGDKTVSDSTVKSASSDVCIVKPYQHGVTRMSGRCVKADGYSISYNTNDIMIVGGAALNVYDYKLKELKERRGLAALETYIKKKTSDIDIVWWPRPSTDKEIITSQSGAIIQLVLVFKAQLIELLNEHRRALEDKIKPYIPSSSNSDSLNITIDVIPTRPAGVININIIFEIKGLRLKMCDVIIHDSGSSQRYDSDGNEITDVRFMVDDPVFCTSQKGYSNSITYLTVNDITIAVPNIQAFVIQQMLAFDNLIRFKQTKAFINYKRVEFIRKILSNFHLNDPNNKQNYSELLEVFGSNSQDYPSRIINGLNRRVDASIFKNFKDILELCETVNKTKDPIIDELCTKATIVAETPKFNKVVMNKYVADEQKRLEELAVIARGKYKTAPLSEFRRAYDDIQRRLDNRRHKLTRMEPTELLKYKEYYETHPDEDIQKLEEIDDAVVKHTEKLEEQKRMKMAEKQKKKNRGPAPSMAPMNRGPLLENPAMRTPFTSAEPPRMMAMPQPRVEFYGHAPPYPPPSYHAPFYVEQGTGRHMRWDPRGFWYYITPPLPMGPPPQSRFIIHQPMMPQYHEPRGGSNRTRRNKRRNNNTKKHI